MVIQYHNGSIMMATPAKPLLAPLTVNYGENIALIKLNTPVADVIDCFRILWNRALLRAVVDGALNELHGYRLGDKQEFLPDIVSGDFDSIKPEILADYREMGVEIISTPDQNQSDFTKCMKIVLDRISTQHLQVSCVVAFVSFNGRLDHIIGNINTLFIADKMTSLPVYLISGEGLACLLPPGEHSLELGTALEKRSCGLIPLYKPAKCVSTTGLRWNLEEQAMELGRLVSTSNYVTDSRVTVKTDAHLLWTMSIVVDDVT